MKTMFEEKLAWNLIWDLNDFFIGHCHILPYCKGSGSSEIYSLLVGPIEIYTHFIDDDCISAELVLFRRFSVCVGREGEEYAFISE